MKTLKLLSLSFIFILMMITIAQAQVLNSQTDIDNFVLPPNGFIIGDLEIHDTSPNDPITSLAPLQGLTTLFSGTLRIENTTQLQNLEGLEQLVKLRNLEIIETENLSLSGLYGLDEIPGHCWIYENSNLQKLEGLNNVKEIGFLHIYLNQGLVNFLGLDNLKSTKHSFWIQNNSGLENLEGLNTLETIGLSFIISDNDGLINLNGLDNLVSTESSFLIRNNPDLISLVGPNFLESVGKDFSIYNNNALQNLEGFGQLKVVGKRLQILSNDNLESVLGLNNVESIGEWLWIRLNPKLESLSDLESLVEVSELRIYSNPELCDCDILTDFVTDPNVVKFIFNNDYGCSSNQEILDDIDCCPEFLIVGTCGWKYVNHVNDICPSCTDGVSHLALMIQDDTGPLYYQGKYWRHATTEGGVRWFIEDAAGNPVEIYNGAWLEIPENLTDADITHVEVDYFWEDKICTVETPWDCGSTIGSDKEKEEERERENRCVLSERGAIINVSITPNPILDYARINIEAETNQNLNIKLFNSLGQMVRDQTITVYKGSNKIELDVQTLEPGVYMYLLDNLGNPKSGKVIKS